MEEPQKYPIRIDSHERHIIIDIIKDQKHKISYVWQQLLDKKDPIMMSAFEQGILMGITVNKRKKIPETWKQLVGMMNKFRENAGVKITELGNNLIQLKDDFGTTIVREKYEWENEYGFK
jgi:hypothetical protein